MEIDVPNFCEKNIQIKSFKKVFFGKKSVSKTLILVMNDENLYKKSIALDTSKKGCSDISCVQCSAGMILIENGDCINFRHLMPRKLKKTTSFLCFLSNEDASKFFGSIDTKIQ